MKEKERFMKMAIELAKRGIGRVSPNPPVGAIVVNKGKVVASAWHSEYGGLHAERKALQNLPDKYFGSELYVTLEPCCHYGKTPPCTDIIIEKGISKVYIGVSDPNLKVAGKGIEILKAHGIEVETGIMESECKKVAEEFFYFHENRVPYVVLKYAMTVDGKIATFMGDSKWITNEISRKKVHELRSRYDSIMVGIGTVIKDDPMLNARIENGKNPTRVVLDSNLRIDENSKIVRTAGDIETMIFTKKTEYDTSVLNCNGEKDENLLDKKDRLKNMGVKVIEVESSEDRVNVAEVLKNLAKCGVTSVLVEGGAELNYSMIKSGYFNKVYTFIGSKMFGGQKAPAPVGGSGVKAVEDAFSLELESVERLENDILAIYQKCR